MTSNCLAQYSNKTLKEDFDFMYNSSAFHLGDFDLTKDGFKISDVDLNNYLKKI